MNSLLNTKENLITQTNTNTVSNVHPVWFYTDGSNKMSSLYGEDGIVVSRTIGALTDPRTSQLQIKPSSELQGLLIRVTNLESGKQSLLSAVSQVYIHEC